MKSLLAAFIVLAAAPALAEDAAPAATPDAKALYAKKCAGCHGADGKADTKQGKKYKIADFTEPAWAMSWNRARVKKVVAEGIEGKMPAWKEKLTPEEIDAITGYVFTLAGAPGHK